MEKKERGKLKIHSTRQAQLDHHGNLCSHKAGPGGFGQPKILLNYA